MKDAPDFLARVLDEAKVRYAVIGGHAVNVWLEPRFTADIDVTIVASPTQLVSLVEALRRRGLEIERQYGNEQPSGPDFTRMVNADRSIILELQTAKTVLQKELVQRAVTSDSGLRVATVEDLIILKLIAFRSKDQIDLEGLARRRDVDWEYVEARCREWDVLERLTELRKND